MKEIKDETLIELLEVLIEYRKTLREDDKVIHLGIKTQAGSSIKYVDDEDDAQSTIRSLKSLLNNGINTNESRSF
jgi:hypothetical protein